MIKMSLKIEIVFEKGNFLKIPFTKFSSQRIKQLVVQGTDVVEP